MKKTIIASTIIVSTIFSTISFNVQPARAAYSRCQKGPNRGSYCFRGGDRSPEIYNLIEQLRCAGYYHLRNDSYFGPVTQRAIRDFQRDQGLYPDGIAGPQTRNLLISRNRNRGCRY